jgi:hypothetical protein
MATITLGDWEKEITNMDRKKIEEVEKALDIILRWEFFNTAFNGFGINVVKSMVSREIKRRHEKYELRKEMGLSD